MVYSYNGYYIRLSAERQGFNSLIDRHYALLAQLVEALVLGTSQCGFESHVRHHKEAGHRVLKRSPRKEPNDAVGNLGIGSYLRVAQFGSASDLGSEGRGFKSHLVDQLSGWSKCNPSE